LRDLFSTDAENRIRTEFFLMEKGKGLDNSIPFPENRVRKRGGIPQNT